MFLWYALVDREVVGPFDTLDMWYHEHAGPDWRVREHLRTGVDPWLLKRTMLPDGRLVSTVFLGLRHPLPYDGDDAPPLVFETTVVDEWAPLWRTSSYDHALAQHDAMVAQLSPVK